MQITDTALSIRQDAFKMAMVAGGGHLASSFSMADVVAELYFDGILRYDAAKPDDPNRDFFILSKGHACMALYSALSRCGFFPPEMLRQWCTAESPLGGHPRKRCAPGVEASTGALGHGLAYAVGIAKANKIDGSTSHVYAMLGDGECQEGSVWESVMAAAHHKLDNLTIIVDYNGLQAMDSIETIMSITEFRQKFAAFDCDAVDIDGHDAAAIKAALTRRTPGQPVAVVAHTVKGKGVSFMENVPIWHYRLPNAAELPVALRELHLTEADLWRR